MNKIKEYILKHKKFLLLIIIVLLGILLYLLSLKPKETTPDFTVNPPSPFVLDNLTLVSSSVKDQEIKEVIDSRYSIELAFSKPVDLQSVDVKITPQINLKVDYFGGNTMKLRIYPNQTAWLFDTKYNLVISNARGQDGSLLESPINITFTLRQPSPESPKGF